MDVDFVQRIMREKSCPSEKVFPPKSGSNGKQRKFRTKNNQNNGKDPRDLLASVNDQFTDPEYLNEIGYHLQKDIEKIKKEVIPLRQRLHIFMKMEENAENLPPEAVTLDVLDPQPKKNADVSQRANQLNIKISELDSQLRTMQKYYVEKTKIELKNDISIHQEKISDLNMKIDCMNEAIQVQNNQIKEIMSSKNREKIDHLNDKISKLSFLLSEMKEEQKEDIDHHFSIVSQRQVNPILQNQLSSLQRQLNSLQYIKAQRQVELNKQMKRYEIQKKSVSAVIERNIQASKNSTRNAKMSKKFTREMYSGINSKQSKNRICSQNSSSSDYSYPENESDNSFKRKYYTTNKNKVSDESSDIYYLEDAEVQTKEIDFRSIVNFGPDQGKRFRHHRRKVRKHPRRDQDNKATSQSEDQDEDIEINYNFPTNIQFLQFPSRKSGNNTGKQIPSNYIKAIENEKIEIETNVNEKIEIETNVNENKNNEIETNSNVNENEKQKQEVEFSLNYDNLQVQVDVSKNKQNNMDTTEMTFHLDENNNHMSDHSDNQTPTLNISENQVNKSTQKVPENLFDNSKVQLDDEETNNDNDVNNSGIRISASFAENAKNILGHSKFVSDNEEEELIESHQNVNENGEKKNGNEILNDFSISKSLQKPAFIPEVIICEEEDFDQKNSNDPFSFGQTNLPCPSLNVKGECCMQTCDTGS